MNQTSQSLKEAINKPVKQAIKPSTKKPLKVKVNGVILIDKPKGMTSQQLVSKVKYLFLSPAHNSKKAGHTGTLDPMATGLLSVCMGEATKFSHYQLDADKSYQATIKLGEQTDTGDAEGKVITTKDVPMISQEQLTKVQSQFLGDLMQIPPMYSALKKDGKKLYEYAREGIEIERPARPITLKQLSLEQLSPTELQLTVTCTKGTYVRVLGEDIATALGTVGHLIALRRTAVGEFPVADSIALDELEALSLAERFDKLLSVDVCLGDMPIVYLDEAQIKRIRNGQRLNVFAQIDPESHAKWFNKTDDDTVSRDVRLYADCLEKKLEENTVESMEEGTEKDETPVSEFLGLGLLEKGGRLQPKKVLNLL